MTKRNSVIKLLVILFAVCLLGFCLATFQNGRSVKAANTEDFSMLGASLRYTAETTEEDDGLGLRFEMKASESFLSGAEETGFVIVPSKLIEEGEPLTVNTARAIINPKSAEDWAAAEGEEGYKRASVYVYGIPEMDKDTELTAVGYALKDGEYQYTDTVKRSMKYIAVAASCDSAQTAEVRAAVEKYTDKGNVAYLGDELFDLTGNALGYSTWAGNSVASDEIFGVTKNVMQTNITANVNGWWVTQTFNSPAVKDISDYKYFSFMIRAAEDDLITVSVNDTASFKIGTTWQRIVFTNTDGVFASSYGNLFGASGASATNLDGLRMVYSGNITKNENGMSQVYLADMYVSNELPQIEGALPEYVMSGAEEQINFTAKEAEGAVVSVKVSVNGQPATDVVNGSQYTFGEAGEHVFTVSLSDGGKLIYSETVTVYCVNSTGNELLYSGNKFGIAINSLEGWQQGGVSFDESLTAPGASEAGVLKVTNTQEGAATAFLAKNPSVQDVTQYKYVYFDVYNPQARDIDFTVEWVYNYPVAKLYANSWTRIILFVSGGQVYMPGAYTDQNGGNTIVTGITGGSFTDVEFAAIGLEMNEYFCIGNVYVSNEKPAVPEGVKGFDGNDSIAFFTANEVVAMNGLVAQSGSGVSAPYGDTYEYGSSGVTLIQGGDYSLAGVKINNPYTKDVSGYKYLYIDVYAHQCDVNFTVNYQYGSPYVTVEQGAWKRIVLENDESGDFIMLNKDGNINGGDSSKVFNGVWTGGTDFAITDITGITLVAQTPSIWQHCIIGAFAGCNELPELPANVTYANYTAE